LTLATPQRSSKRSLVGQTKELTAEVAEVAEVAEARTEKSTNARVSIGQLESISQLVSISQLESGSRSRSHLATQDERSVESSAAARQDERRPERRAFRTNRSLKVPLSVCYLTNSRDVADRKSSQNEKNLNVCSAEVAEVAEDRTEDSLAVVRARSGGNPMRHGLENELRHGLLIYW